VKALNPLVGGAGGLERSNPNKTAVWHGDDDPARESLFPVHFRTRYCI